MTDKEIIANTLKSIEPFEIRDIGEQQQAEIERLTANLRAMEQTLPNCAKAERAEAIKEFAKRMKESEIDIDVSFGYGRECYTKAVATIEIDNLVKEMVGENNENSI